MGRQKLRNFTRLDELEDLAQQLLTLYEKKTGKTIVFPVPINDIAREVYHLRIEPRKQALLGDGVDGILLFAEKTIYYSDSIPFVRARFTISHELIHYVLKLIGDQDLARLIDIWDYQKTSESKAEGIERCANYISSVLLMPLPLINAFLKKFDKINAEAIEALAKTGAVSVESMFHRITDLLERKLINRIVDYHSIELLKEKIDVGKLERQGTIEDHLQANIENEKQPFISQDKSYSHHSLIVDLVIDDLRTQGIGIEYRTRYRRNMSKTVDKPMEKFHKPYIIELSGPPNSGKDTQSHILAQYFINIRDYSVKVFEEPYHACPVDGLEYVEKYLWTVLTTCRNLILDLPPRYDVIIINRGVFDSLAYLNLYQELGQLSKKEYKLYSDLLTQPRWKDLIDTVFLLYVSPEESIQREEKQQRETVASLASKFDPAIDPRPHQNIINWDVLPILMECYDSTYQQYKGQFRRIIMLDNIDHVDVTATAFSMVKNIHNELPPGKMPGAPTPLLNSEDFNKNGKKPCGQLILPGFDFDIEDISGHSSVFFAAQE